jgi:hypothetical protein
MRLDESGCPQPTGEFETIEADSLVLALGQDVDLCFLERVSGLEIINAVVKVNAQMMTGHPGVFDGRRHGSSGTDRYRCGWTWEKSCPKHQCLAARYHIPFAIQARACVVRQAQHMVVRKGSRRRPGQPGRGTAPIHFR